MYRLKSVLRLLELRASNGPKDSTHQERRVVVLVDATAKVTRESYKTLSRLLSRGFASNVAARNECIVNKSYNSDRKV